MSARADPRLIEWLRAPDNPPVRYLTARDLLEPRPSARTLRRLRADIFDWDPLQRILSMQLADGSFPYRQKTPTAQPSISALCLMNRCGLAVGDEPVDRLVRYLTDHHLTKGALSYTSGGSGILPCYLGVVSCALIDMGALDTELVQSSLRWLVDHQRFDHRETRAGGEKTWPYRAPVNYGCWESVSCYHGVAGAFRAFAAVPAPQRSADVSRRLDEALEYLRIHRLYKKSSVDAPLFRHMTRFFLIGDYRSDLLDMLQGVADADPALGELDWVRSAVGDMDRSTAGGRVPLIHNYGRQLVDPLGLEPIGEPSRFLTYQWLRVQQVLAPAAHGP